jgi:hypothetical protein
MFEYSTLIPEENTWVYQRKLTGTGGICVMRSFIVCVLHQILLVLVSSKEG